MAFAGIDVGAKGGIALLSERGEVLNLRAMPSMCGKFNIALMLEALREVDEQARLHAPEGVRFCILEQVGAFPGQGVSSMFSFGYNAGAIEGCISALAWPYQLVRPQAWQKMMHVGIHSAVDPKVKSLMAAKRLFPKETFLATSRSSKPHDGIVDAVLMAEYGRRIHSGLPPLPPRAKVMPRPTLAG